jgi:hypothetical protein
MDTRLTVAEGENAGSPPERRFDFKKNEVFENGAELVTLLAFLEPTDADDIRRSRVRATRVAVSTANSSGKMKDRSRPVSSIVNSTAEMGPWVVAANTAAARTTANKPGGTQMVLPNHTSWSIFES